MNKHIGLLAWLVILCSNLLWPIAAMAASRSTPVYGCTDASTAPTFDPNDQKFLAGDTSALIPNQGNVNCFAWQSFIAMNWPVDQAWPGNPDMAGAPDRSASVASWGVQANPKIVAPTPTVWETFAEMQNVFLPGAAPPPAWGSDPGRPNGCPAGSGGFHVDPSQNLEATGGWLTDQVHGLAWFGQHVGRAEFNYIVGNRLYDAAVQIQVATRSPGIALPSGVAPGSGLQGWQDLGAIEIKSAWRVLTRHPELWHRYLLAKAWVQYTDKPCQEEIVGLVGLHILRKTQTFPTFMWSTFEQVDNVPGQGASGSNGYAYNNPHCQGKYCKPNVPRIRHDKHLFPQNQPVQTTRVVALSNDVQKLNRDMHELIASKTGGKSVFQYYELVNVLWPATVQGSSTGPNKLAPLNIKDGMEPTQAVANTSMETYVQTTTCTGCHAYATILGSKNLASDYSFAFSHAKYRASEHGLAAQAMSQSRRTSRCEARKHMVTRDKHIAFSTHPLDPACLR